METSQFETKDLAQDNPMPSRNHSRVAHNLSVALDPLSDRYSICPQLSLRLNDWSSVPDISVFRKGVLDENWLSDDEEISIAPALAIEIVSPNQPVQALIDKVGKYLQFGVKSCWLVEPATRVISVFPATGGSRAFVEGNVIDEPLGISVPIGGIFR